MMEEILFWVVNCRDCQCLYVVDHVEKLPNGDVMCPTCRTASANMWVQGFGRSVFDHFSEEACLKIHDALTTPSHRFIERHIAQGIKLKEDLKKLEEGVEEEDDRLGVAPNDPWRR